MPKTGRDYKLQFALEDPDPELQNGSGISQLPDMVLAARFQPTAAAAYKTRNTA